MPERVGLPEKLLATHHALEGTQIPHAFGGALALAFHGEPRATVDIDVNVFAGREQSAAALGALASAGAAVDGAREQAAQAGQCRAMLGQTPIDIFFADLAFHRDMQRAVRNVPFAGESIPIVGAEHLMVCKMWFNRPKDWIDIEQMLVTVPDLRVSEVRRWMNEIAGPDDARTQRLDALLREMLAR
jgi:hypothetical protein